MGRYKFLISYDGYNYYGFQIQEELPTIELELKKAFYKLIQEDVKIYSSGRTDRYVHAVGQVFHADIISDIPSNGLIKGLNAYLPNDIHIETCEAVDSSFHARFSALKKEYRYYINTDKYNPLTIRYMPYIPNLDIKLMNEALGLLVGTHDFKGFASASIDPRKPTIKTIYSIKMNKTANGLEFIFIGDGFLKYQIRRMMGLIIEIGKKKLDKNIISNILESCNPADSKYIADGCGLYLYSVLYD